MKPRQLVSRLLTNLDVRAVLGKIAHIFEVADGKPPHVGKVGFQVGGKALDDLVPPCVRLLVTENFEADVVIEADEFRIDRQRRAQTHTAYLPLQRVKPHSVIHGWVLFNWNRFVHGFSLQFSVVSFQP